MTENRLYEILNQVHGAEPIHKSHLIIEAMKQAVNESFDEAAEKASTKWIKFENPKYGIYGEDIVNKESILNLKVK